MRQAIEWKKIFAKNISDKRLLSNICKEPLKPNIRKWIISEKKLNKWAKVLKIHFTKQDIEITNKYMRRCSTLYVIAAAVTSVVSDSVRPHRRQPTRLSCPWDSPGKNTGVGCHFLLKPTKVKSESEVTQLCLTLSDLLDCSLPGSSVHGIFQEYWSGLPLPSPIVCH